MTPQGQQTLELSTTGNKNTLSSFNPFHVQDEMSRVVRKPAFSICVNKDADQLRGNRKADQLVFARQIVQSLFYLNPKFQASSHLLGLYSPVCVGPGRKPQRPVFSRRGSNNYFIQKGNFQKQNALQFQEL